MLNADETYAVTLKSSDVAVDNIGLMIGDKSDLGLATDEEGMIRFAYP